MGENISRYSIRQDGVSAPELFRSNLTRLIKSRFGTRAEFLRHSGMSKSTLDSWAYGVACPEMAKLDDLASWLGVPVQEFFRAEDRASNNTETTELMELSQVAREAYRLLGTALSKADKALGVPPQSRGTIDTTGMQPDEAERAQQLDKTRPTPGRRRSKS